MKRRCNPLRLSHFLKLLLLQGFLLAGFTSVTWAQVSLSADVTSGCAPLGVNFTATAPANATGFIWDFGDNTTSTQQNPGRIYTQSGTYTVTLTVTFASGAPVTVSQTNYITVFAPPRANFTATPQQVCAGAPVQFNDNTTAGSAPVTSWLWNFGGLGQSTQQNPSRTFNQTGLFNIALQVTDANGCTDLIFKNGYLRVSKPDASFTFDKNIACNPPLRVQFTSSGSNIASHNWSFGNGTTSALPNPSILFSTVGSFTVTHIVTDNFGCSDTTTRVGLVNIGQTNASITTSANPVCAGTPVTFFCGSTSALSVAWSFGPGQGTSSQCDPVRTFNSPGNYTINLTINEPNNCVLTATTVLQVLPRPNVSFSAPVLVSCQTPFAVSFNNTSTALPGTNWAWNFDAPGGPSSTARNPTHNYSQPGLYTVSLTAVDPNGCRNTLTRPAYIKVSTVSADLDGVPTKGCNPLTVNFQDISTSNSPKASWFWDFGDGTSSTLQNPQKTYTMTGSYTVKLIVTNADGCVDSVSYTNFIQVGDTVNANFVPSDTVLCGKDTVRFTNLSTGNVTQTIWTFGDGGMAGSFNATYTFTDTGYQWVQLVVEDRGCSDTLRLDSLVYIKPAIARFTGNLIGCDTPHTVMFREFSLGADEWFWDFGTGNPGDTSRLQNPSFTYTQTGSYQVTMWAYNLTTGCYDSLTKTVAIDLLDVKGGIDNTGGCSPARINFTDSSFNAVSRLWFFEAGSFSGLATPSYTYSDPGIYYPRLRVYNSIGCVEDTVFGPIYVLRPVVNFALPDTNVCAPYTATFTNSTQSVAPVSTWQWTFGNGLTSNQQTPTLNYNNPGHYTVSLVATDSAGCVGRKTRSQYLYVSDPRSFFTIDEPINCIGNTLNFTNTSTGQSSLTYAWDFGDGGTSGQQNPAYGYTQNGNYQATLVVTDSIGCEDTLSRTVVIDDPSITAQADTTFASCPPLLVNFTGIANSPHNFNSWSWDFGDGNAAFTQNSSNLYAVPGNYTVTLVATSSAGCNDTVQLGSPIQVLGPYGFFNFSPTSGCPDLTVNFSGQFTSTVSNRADMGDGTLLAGNPILQNFSHTYTSPGVYFPVMILEDGQGCRVPITPPDSVVVFPLPQVDFGVSSPNICDTGTVSFTDLTTVNANIATWFWDFGDGTTSNLQNPTHFYTQPDTYDVKLIVTTVHGCVDSIFRPAAVISHPLPRAALALSDTAGCLPFQLVVRDASPSSNAPLQSWLWDFGLGGATGSRQVDTFTYTLAGTYTVRLTITDIYGCQAEADTTVTAWPLPVADFRVAPDSFGCAPSTLQFTDRSSPVVDWQWNFGDGGTSSQQNPNHFYLNDGQYTVSLTVTDFRGCRQTRTKPAYIRLGHPVADFSAAPVSGCPGLVVSFLDRSLTDTSIVNWQWDFGDGTTGVGPAPVHVYNNPGTYSVRLIVTDFFGCSDTLFQADLIEIWEDILPETPQIQRVTVVSDTEVQIEWQPYSNLRGDFGRYVLYREQPGGTFTPVFNTSNLSQTQFVETGLNTQSQSYCYKIQVENFCGTASLLEATETHCTMLLSTVPQVDQIELSWTPYVGWDQVDYYQVYRVSNYAQNGAQLLATLNGDVTRWVDENMFCYDAQSYRILAKQAGQGEISFSNLSEAAPIHFPPSNLSHMVRATVEDSNGTNGILLEWQLPALDNPREVVVERDEGAGYRPVFGRPFGSAGTAFFDANVNVNAKPYRYHVYVLDRCGDRTPIGRDATSILLQAERTRGRIFLNWTPYQTWANGVAAYQVEIYNDALGRFEVVDRVSGQDTAFEDTKSDYQQGYYCYRVRAFENGGLDTVSLSNEACVTIDPTFFAPNAFTPNGDGLNDVFSVEGVFLDNYSLQIFNRWGEKIFESFQLGQGWDGKYKGRDVPEGAYVFIANGRGYNGKLVNLRGTVTLVR